MNHVEMIINEVDGGEVELARRLTLLTKDYYQVQTVRYWKSAGRIPAEHMSAVSKVTGVPIEQVCPEYFVKYSEGDADGEGDKY